MRNEFAFQYRNFYRVRIFASGNFLLKKVSKIKMHRGLIWIGLIVAVLGNAIDPSTDFSTKKVRQLELVEALSNSDGNNQAPIYSGSSLQPMHHFYPTYPEHKSGFDGYLIPIEPPKQSWTSNLFSALVPLSTYALTYATQAGVYIWNFFILLFMGGILTTSICTFTPFCTITFLGFGINKNQVKEQVSELARQYITPESMSAATLLVKRAIEKYAELRRQQEEEERALRKEKKSERRRRR